MQVGNFIVLCIAILPLQDDYHYGAPLETNVALMYLSTLCPTVPLQGDIGKRCGDLSYTKFICITYWACQSVKFLPSPHLKHRDLQGNLLVNVNTSVLRMVSSYIPHI